MQRTLIFLFASAFSWVLVAASPAHANVSTGWAVVELGAAAGKDAMPGSLALAEDYLEMAVGAADADEIFRASVGAYGRIGDGEAIEVALSADGRFVAFSSTSTNLVAGDADDLADIYVLDRQTGVVELVSRTAGGTKGNGESSYPSISDDGRYVAFLSASTNLLAGDTDTRVDVYVKDRQTGALELASVSSDEAKGTLDCDAAQIAGGGRYVVFQSFSTNLVPGDTNNLPSYQVEFTGGDIFVRDRMAGTTERVNVSSAGAETALGQNCDLPTITPDGRYVAFDTRDSSLDAADTNTRRDVYVRDRQLGVTKLVSLGNSGEVGPNTGTGSRRPSISADGRYVAFDSDAPNLVAGDTNGSTDVFVRDTVANTTVRVSVATGGAQAEYPGGYVPETGEFSGSRRASISYDGRYLAFDSEATNLEAGDANGARDVFVRDRLAGTTARVSESAAGADGDGRSWPSAMAGDGGYVGFVTGAANLAPGDTNGMADVYVTGNPFAP